MKKITKNVLFSFRKLPSVFFSKKVSTSVKIRGENIPYALKKSNKDSSTENHSKIPPGNKQPEAPAVKLTDMLTPEEKKELNKTEEEINKSFKNFSQY